MIKNPPFFHPITLFFHTTPQFFPCFFSHRMMQNKCFSTTMKQSECASDKAVFYPQKSDIFCFLTSLILFEQVKKHLHQRRMNV